MAAVLLRSGPNSSRHKAQGSTQNRLLSLWCAMQEARATACGGWCSRGATTAAAPAHQ